MSHDASKLRWYHLTPDRLLLALLPIIGLLFLSERFCWFAFNEHKNWTVLIAVAVVGVALLLMFLWFGVSLVSRLRFQFSTRSMLVFVAVVAVVCSWFAVKMQQARRQREVVVAVEKDGGYVAYDYEYDSDGNVLPGPAWPLGLRNLVGVDFLSDVRSLDYRSFDCNGQVTDAGLMHLKGLTSLQHLMLAGSRVTDAGLIHLKGMTMLQYLDVIETQVTDAGLEHLKGMTNLKFLWLGGTHVTDAGLEHLKGLPNLQSLDLNDTQVTDEGVKKLQEALPNCNITH